VEECGGPDGFLLVVVEGIVVVESLVLGTGSAMFDLLRADWLERGLTVDDDEADDGGRPLLTFLIG
jgi:hypothetical protein